MNKYIEDEFMKTEKTESASPEKHDSSYRRSHIDDDISTWTKVKSSSSRAAE